jgi:hypothetical protein
MQKDGGIRPKLGSKVSLAGRATMLNTVAMAILALNDESCQQKISELLVLIQLISQRIAGARSGDFVLDKVFVDIR